MNTALPEGHLFEQGTVAFFYDAMAGVVRPLHPAMAEATMASARHGDVARVRLLMRAANLELPAPLARPAPVRVPMRSISLAIASQCNLGCTYCYAQQGSFGGGDATPMPLEVAKSAIATLLKGTLPGEAIRVIFLGGEPLLGRAALREATRFAVEAATQHGVTVDFAITTNATVLKLEDVDFLDEHAFAVTVSIDGLGAVHDRLRPFLGGLGSFRRVQERVQPLLQRPARRCTVQARVSVTPSNLGLRDTYEGLLGMGFDSIHFSPVLRSPSGTGEMDAADLERMLTRMCECGAADVDRFLAGDAPRLANLASMVGRIARGASDDYPCAAGGSYAGVSAEGGLYACHRFVGDEAARLGDVSTGIDTDAQRAWLADRHVMAQTPCGSCWARHLCGGGCHFEAMGRGRAGCDYIRGWLEHCLRTYVRLVSSGETELTRYLAGHARGG